MSKGILLGRHKIRSTVSHNQTFSIAEHKQLLDLYEISRTKLESALQDLGFEVDDRVIGKKDS